MPGKCPICNATSNLRVVDLTSHEVDCPRCGKYLISSDCMNLIQQALAIDVAEITKYARRESSGYDSPAALFIEVAKKATKGKGIDEPRSIISHVLRERANKQSIITTDVLVGILKSNSMPTPAEQADNFVLFLGETLPSPGSSFVVTDSNNMLVIDQRLYCLVGIKTGNEWCDLHFIITSLDEQRLIKVQYQDGIIASGGRKVPTNISLTLAGWQHYEALTRRHVESRTAFMAMKFNNADMSRVLEECFKPAVEETGFILRILTDKQEAGLIDDQLRVALRRAKFVIADLTHNNNGAYWEAGFAEGLGRPVIYTCRKAEWDERQTHFDTNHLVTIVWDETNLSDAAKKLANTIRATLPLEAT